MSKFLARGKRGIVSVAVRDGVGVVVKERNPKSAVDTIANEAAMLVSVNRVGIGPQFIAYEGGALTMELIEGEPILAWAETASLEELRTVFTALLMQCRTLDVLKLNKGEMNHPYKHILVRHGLPVQIDFERMRITQSPQNVTQVCQWITGSVVGEMLAVRGIVLDRSLVSELAKTYKKNYSEEAFMRLREVVCGW